MTPELANAPAEAATAPPTADRDESPSDQTPPDETPSAACGDGAFRFVETSRRGEPTWELAAMLFPKQGEWTLEQFHELVEQDEDLRVEFAEGCLEFLPVPSKFHEILGNVLFAKLLLLLGPRRVFFGGYELEAPNGSARFPDLLAARSEDSLGPKRATAADLVIEVVSPGRVQHDRDFRQKRTDYASAGVGEYWIVDPETRTVLVLRLKDGAYVEAGTFVAGQTAASAIIDGFAVAVDELFAAAEDGPAAE